LERIYREHRDQLFHLAWLVLRDHSLAEDALHDAFVKLKQIENQPTNALFYARTSVRNIAIDIRRSRQVRATEPLSHDLATGGRTMEELEVEEMLLKLSGGQREVVEMHLRLGMSFKEIAGLLDEPLSTVSSRYRRALDAMRDFSNSETPSG